MVKPYVTFWINQVNSVKCPNLSKGRDLRMKYTIAKIVIFIFASLTFKAVEADQLIAKNWLSSGQDWYLIEDSVDWAGKQDVYAAVSYLQLEEPRNYLEIFDNDFNAIGKNVIGNYRSYAYFSIFDCGKNLEADYSIMYFSTDRPTKGQKIHEEILDTDFGFPMEQSLMDNVCIIGRSKQN